MKTRLLVVVLVLVLGVWLAGCAAPGSSDLAGRVAVLEGQIKALQRANEIELKALQQRWVLTPHVWLVNLNNGLVIKWECETVELCRVWVCDGGKKIAVFQRFDGADAKDKSMGWIRCFAQDLGAWSVQ